MKQPSSRSLRAQNYFVGTSDSATVTLHDDEPTVSVTATDSIAAEPGSDTGVYTFTRTNAGSALVVNYTLSGTAVHNTDYSTLTGTVTIPNGSSSVTLTLIPKDDATFEGDETAILTLVPITPTPTYFIGAASSATITLQDNETTVTVSATDNSGTEPGTSDKGVYTFTRTGTGAALTVNYTMSGTAVNNTDYSTLNGSVTIPSGSSTVTLTITPKDDAFAEGDETAILTLSASANYFIGTPSGATVTIHDDEPTVTVTATDTDGTEPGTSDKGVYTFTRTNAGTALIVNYTMSGTAVNNTDYSTLNGSVTIPNGSSTVTLTITPKDDTTAEGDETAILTIAPVTPTATYFIGTPNSATVTIHDDEPTVTVTATDNTAAEPGSNTGVYTFTRTNAGSALAVSYTMSGTAVNNTDYSTLNGTVTIPNGSSSVTLTIIPKDDSSAEGSETAILTISTNSSYFVGTPNSATVTILDDEPTVTVTASDSSATEQGQSTGVFTITRSNAGNALAVVYGMTGTATNVSDYSSLSGTVTIPSGSSSVNVTVTPIDDASAEGDETVILTISSNSSYFIGSPNSATVTIADNDATINGQAGGTFAKNDNESFFGDVNLSQAYTLSSSITASGTITISNADSLHGKFFIGHFSQSTANNRREYMGLQLEEGDVDGWVTVRARINRVNGEPISDAYSDAYATLTSAGGPYTFTYTYDPSYENDAGHAGPEGRLTLQIAGQTLYAINVGSHRDDGSTFDAFGIGIPTLSINGTPSGDDPTSTAKMFLDDVSYTGHTGTVNFNTDPGWASLGNTSSGNSYGWNLISVSATDANAAEQSQNPGVFTISRGTTTGNLAVYYTLGGTATNNSDYSSLAGTVTISNGSSTATVTVTPIDDAIVEGDETVVLTLASNVNYTLSPTTSATVAIADNDATVNGQVGGTFAQNDNESYFGDTHLSQSYTLNSTITARAVSSLPGCRDDARQDLRRSLLFLHG